MCEQAEEERQSTVTFVRSEKPMFGWEAAAFLSPRDYREVFNKWLDKGGMTWRAKSKPEHSLWRRQFAKRLADVQADEIVKSIRRSKKDERDELRVLLNRVNN